MGINYYSILQLKRHCTEDDVHTAFGKRMFRRPTSDGIRCSLVALCEAFEVLSDPFRRALYDDHGEEGLKSGIWSGETFIDPWTYDGDVNATCSKYCARSNPISDLVIRSNGTAPISFKKNKVLPCVVHLPLKLTLDEVFRGSTKLVEVKEKSMQINDSTAEKTQAIEVNVPRGFPAGGTIQSVISKAENGIEVKKTVYVFTTEDIPHKVFKRDKTNLIMVETVSMKQMFYGTKLTINTLDNKVLRVNITQVITNDYCKIIHNEGMPEMNHPTQRGDIVIKFNVVYPLYSQFPDQTMCEMFNDDSNDNT